MFCTACGRQLEDRDIFCGSCGKSVHPAATPPAVPKPVKKLSRPMNDKKIAGVCAGFARYLEVDVTLVRILWLLVVLVAGTGILAYIVAWIAMPADYGLAPSAGSTPVTAAPQS